MKKLKNGPSIHVTFHVERDTIREINLEATDRQGLSWSIDGKNCSPQLEHNIAAWLASYCDKQQPAVKLPLDLSYLTPFTLSILTILQKVPFQCFLSYQDLAELNKSPKAARAVGGACGRNPFPLVIPCHRVLAKDSHIGGFSAGPEIKETLLDFEGISYVPKLA